ncbi:MAG: succinyl-diaminopimelate desuccinylase [Actinomycetota bacterium]
MTLLEAAHDLVVINSVSRNEKEIADFVEQRLRLAGHLSVTRIGDNVVASSTGSRMKRVLIAGHLDTVPGNPERVELTSERLIGLGACDMKGSLAVMLAQAQESDQRRVETSWIFYAREEISRAESGLLEIAAARPDLLRGDVAIVAEPTGGTIEAGCQGSMRVKIEVSGARAHTARPWTGVNAIHRLGQILEVVSRYEPLSVMVDGLEFQEQLQAVLVEGGVASNVVPDYSSVTLNYRVAPGRDEDEATNHLTEMLQSVLHEGDVVTVLDWAPPAQPHLANEEISRLLPLVALPARAKVGWTDVATFAQLGIPAVNFGAGDPLLAHRSDEYVTESELADFDRTLRDYLN